MTEHRVTMLRSSLRRRTDPTRSRDPKVQALVTQLATLPIAPAPDPQFRAELRAQLVAIAARIVADSAADTTVTTKPAAAVRSSTSGPAKHTDSGGVLDRLRGVRPARALTIAASIVTVLALLLGGAVWMSRKAIPGDALYGLKRASERVQLATASNDGEKARDLLHFAATRAREVRALLARASSTAMGSAPLAGGRVNSQTKSLVNDTLDAADSNVRSAARLLNTEAVRKGSTDPLKTMSDWAPSQLNRLQDITAAAPDATMRARAAFSTRVVAAALQRASSLRTKVDCSCMQNVATDEFGPVPCNTCAKAAPTPSPGSGGINTGAGTQSGAGTGPGNAKTAAPRGPAAKTESGSGSGPTTARRAAPPSRSSRPGLPLPTVPTAPKHTTPGIQLGPCGLTASVGGLGIGLRLCTPTARG